MKCKVLTVLAIASLGGCAVEKELVPVSGSRADGIVRESYEYGQFEKPVVDWARGQSQAAQRCEAWGYKNAEPFGGTVSQCEAANGYGCVRWMATVTYQCTNKAPGVPASVSDSDKRINAAISADMPKD